MRMSLISDRRGASCRRPHCRAATPHWNEEAARMVPVDKTIEILAALVGFDTVSRNSNLPLMAWIEDYLARLGVQTTRIPDATGAKTNLWATIGPAGVPGTILSGHTDVVPVDGQAWSSDPFHLVERAGRLYGRGATDM